MDTFQLCEPCVSAMQNFGVFEWIILGLLVGLTLISVFTKKNYISMGGDLVILARKIKDKATPNHSPSNSHNE